MCPARLDATLDHVAVAVYSHEVAAQRWAGELGGGTLARAQRPTFAVQQLRFGNGAKLELLAPPPEPRGDNFVLRYLERYGAGIHHVTLKVDDLERALGTVREAGYDVVDVQATDPLWQEGFLRPSQVGGLVVQIATQAGDDDAWAARAGSIPEAPRMDAAALRGPLLAHPDPERARALWSLLGAEVTDEPDRLLAQWPSSPLTVAVVGGDPAGPRGLRFAGSGSLPPSPTAGPAVLEEAGRDRA